MSRFAGRVIVYSIVGCPHCKAAKHSLTEQNVPYVDVSVDKYQKSVREEVKQRTGKSTVPQIYFNERFIGGNEELHGIIAEKVKWDELVELIRTTPAPDEAPAVPDGSLKLPDDDADAAGIDFKCEPDEYAKLVAEFKAAGIIGDNRKGLFLQKNTFLGSQLVTYLTTNKQLSIDEAVRKGQYLIDNHFAHSVKHQSGFENSDKLYRLLEDDDSNALNHGDASECLSKSVNDLGEDLRKLILKIYNSFLSADGRKVDYDGISKSEDFKRYQEMTLLLHRVKVEDASREEKLAFFINVYNALVIHANVVRGPPTNLWQRYKFFNTVRYIVGGQSYSLQDIENGVLRANRKGVGMLFRPFGTGDPRLKVALKEHEPLIHFALVCGAKSCPPIKTYSAEGIMDQLRTASQSFMEGDDVAIDVDSKIVSVSKIFSWYKEDFGGSDKTLVKWLVDNLGQSQKKADMRKLYDEGKFKVTFQNYDWSVNK